MKEKRHRLCLLYGHDTELYGHETDGDTLQCGKDTKELCNLALIHVMRPGTGKFTIALGSGKDRNFPEQPELKHLMRDCLKSSLVNQGYEVEEHAQGETLVFGKAGYEMVIIRCSKGDEWGIFMETMEMINLVAGVDFSEVIIIALKFRIPRIEQTLSYFSETGEVMSLSCTGNPTVIQHFLEPFKSIKVWILGTFYLKKLNKEVFA